MTAKSFNGITVPADGEVVKVANGKATTPNKPVVAYINGDGIGPEISVATRRVIDAAVSRSYGDTRQIKWYEIIAGEEGTRRFNDLLPADTLAAIRHFGVAIKGPLSTPTGGDQRSINVGLRQKLDLNRCIRPFRHFTGVPTDVKRPEKVNIVLFRENVEDVYAGIEFKMGSEGATKLRACLAELGVTIREDTGIGIKIMSKYNTERIIRAAIQYALDNKLPSVTIVHKGNIQKATEGAFCEWGYELAAAEFGDKTISEKALKAANWVMPEGKVLVIKDCIADAMLAEVVSRPERHPVVVTMNLNGDYLSDLIAACVGGLGIAPGANIGDDYAIFEATHGTAADIAGQNLANPCSLLLSAVQMLEFFGWTEASKAVIAAIEATIGSNTLTGDLARLVPGSTKVTTSAFADALIANLPAKA